MSEEIFNNLDMENISEDLDNETVKGLNEIIERPII